MDKFQRMITDYVRNTETIWSDLVQAFVLSLANERRGPDYDELTELIKSLVFKGFADVIGEEGNRSVEQTIVYCELNGVWYEAIAKYYYSTLYATAQTLRITQVEAHNEAMEYQEQYAQNEAKFFEDKYLDVFNEFPETSD